MVQFDNSYARLPDRFFTKIAPEMAPAPEMVLWNAGLAELLGVSDWDAEICAGNVIPDGADPLAQVYAGHQFGGFSPQLGDGRAVLLGEVLSDAGRFDIHLKGAGRTPYSRNGDGRAWVGPVLREFIVSEFMAAAGVPTTRALAAVRTGGRVQRERGYPGAVLVRVAASHIRVGTFQFFTARGDNDAVRALTEHVRARHYPDASDTLDLYAKIVAAQARLIAKWMGLGFVHGVMNTDNMTVSGETIDYGPCAFIDGYSPKACYSSIDQHGRYAYEQQPSIAHWNLAQLGSCFVPQMEEELGGEHQAVEALTEVLNSFPELYQTAWVAEFGRKLGLADATREDVPLIQGLLGLMAEHGADFTNTFAGLRDGTARDWFLDRAAFDHWAEGWTARRSANWEEIVARANPALIPRTHRIEQAIQASLEGDDSLAHRLAETLAKPFTLKDEDRDLTFPPTKDEIVPQTFCGT
ncbi:protein adenylyltransferase SelO [Celeribacter litoreus]|uniref:protein adenylyltransferase SelO n=1 Tax=Celeribacter litoreus TaxID=2876714 RepID=UPI001CCCCF59|nr:YdiU family protein [Celeribacter litoreus]MCA0044737.1 YdiU family protein [Celeribacter litoreus]